MIMMMMMMIMTMMMIMPPFITLEAHDFQSHDLASLSFPSSFPKLSSHLHIRWSPRLSVHLSRLSYRLSLIHWAFLLSVHLSVSLTVYPSSIPSVGSSISSLLPSVPHPLGFPSVGSSIRFSSRPANSHVKFFLTYRPFKQIYAAWRGNIRKNHCPLSYLA